MLSSALTALRGRVSSASRFVSVASLGNGSKRSLAQAAADQQPATNAPVAPASTSKAGIASKTSVSDVRQEHLTATRRAEPFSGNPMYDVVIVGGGVTGTALLYELAKFTDLKKIALVERRNGFANVASGPNSNSQTIHCGDIETNYTVDKAKVTKKHADMLRNFACSLPDGDRDECIFEMQKMVLGVGDEECAALEARYKVFKELFPRMEFMGKQQLRDVEPNVVKVTNHMDRPDAVNAIVIRGEHSAVNYFTLANAFVRQAQIAAGTNKEVDVRLGTEIQSLRFEDDQTYALRTSQGDIRARFVVVSACGHSLLMAHRLGYGLQYSCLPVAGSFYLCKEPVLLGKVYTIQDPKLPFAAVHGDPDVAIGRITRFGPTALPMPLLERYNWRTVTDFFQVAKIDLRVLSIYMFMMREQAFRRYLFRNIFFELPYYGLRSFLQDAKKIIPGMKAEDLQYADGYGGVRPQLVDKQQMKMVMGEGKILGNRIVFNITPSPGGTTCLGNGEKDMRMICKELGANIDEKLLDQTLIHNKAYPIDYA